MGDFYEILGIETEASSAEVKRAYRDIARQYHPDKNPDDRAAEEIFKSAAEAYRVLSDEKLRRQYDRRKKEQEEAARKAPARRPGDVFEDIFRGKKNVAPAPPKPGHDLRFSLEIDLEEAASGIKNGLWFHARLSVGLAEGPGPSREVHRRFARLVEVRAPA